MLKCVLCGNELDDGMKETVKDFCPDCLEKNNIGDVDIDGEIIEDGEG